MPLLRRKRVTAMKIEGTAGTAEALAAADATVHVWDAKITPNIDMEAREGQGSFSKLASVPGMRGGTATFRTELTGNGAGGVPVWASNLLPACRWVNSAGTFTPRSEGPGSNVKTLTIGTHENGLYRQLHGAMGTFVINLLNKKPVSIDWTFQGIYSAPTDVAILTPTYLTHPPFVFTAETLTLGSWTPIVDQLTLDAGNQVILREDATKTSGIITALVTDGTPTGSIPAEAVLVATVNHTSLWLAGTLEALTIEMDNGVDRITIAAPKCQRMKVEEGDREGIQTDQIDFQCCKSADLGDDDLSISFAATD